MNIAYRRSWPLLLPLCLSLALWACGGDDDDDGAGGDGTTIDASPDDPPDAGADPDAPGGEPDAGKTICGGFTGAQCDDDEYCDYPDDACGSADGAGVCEPRPEVCVPEGTTVCGCDGLTYANKCEAARAGTDVASISICEVTAGHDPL